MKTGKLLDNDVKEEKLTRMEDIDQPDKSRPRRFLYLWKTRKKLILAAVGFVVILGLFLTYRSAISQRDELKQQMETQSQQMERQNQVIDGLTAKINEQEEIIKNSVPVITSETLKEKLSTVSELVTQQYVYTNADKYEADQTWIFGWKRPFSSKSILVTYDGTIKAGMDLTQVVIDVDEENHVITVTLPESKVTDNSIPQDSITVVEVKNGLFNEVTLDDYNQFISEQKIIMENRAISRGILEEADKKARELVMSTINLLPGIGEYNVVID